MYSLRRNLELPATSCIGTLYSLHTKVVKTFESRRLSIELKSNDQRTAQGNVPNALANDP